MCGKIHQNTKGWWRIAHINGPDKRFKEKVFFCEEGCWFSPWIFPKSCLNEDGLIEVSKKIIIFLWRRLFLQPFMFPKKSFSHFQLLWSKIALSCCKSYAVSVSSFLPSRSCDLFSDHFFYLIWFDSLRPINNLSVKQGRVFLGWTSTKLG